MRHLSLFMIAIILILTACTPQVTPLLTTAPVTDIPAPIVITDALGRIVTLPVAPQRIVITGKGLFMIADAVYLFPEAADRIVALGNASQGGSNFISMIDPIYAQKVILDDNAGAEQIAALQPDLVILKSYLAETVGQPIQAIGIPIVYVDFETPEQYTRDISVLGQIFQNEARAREVTAFYNSKVEQIQKVVSNVESKPRTLLLYYNDKDGIVAFNVPPYKWMQTTMVEMAGGDPVWAGAVLGNGWTQVTFEQIAAWNADQVFIVAYNKDPSVVVSSLKADPNWRALRAVQDGNIYPFPADLYSWDQPDTRWILGLTWLAGHLHPDLYPNLDIIAEAQAFYQSLYGLDAAFFKQNILPQLKENLP